VTLRPAPPASRPGLGRSRRAAGTSIGVMAARAEVGRQEFTESCELQSGATFCLEDAAERAARQLPNSVATTLADGHCPPVKRIRASPPRCPCVRPRPVIRRRQPSMELAPGAHRVEHPLASPATLDRAEMTALAVRVRVALAVARLRVGAAAAAHADVAGLDRPRLLAGRVLEVRLHRRRGAAETVGDLPDREAFELSVMPRQGHRPATLENPIRPRG
jgi:hypothetical protein